MNYFVGIDIGSTTIKIALCDEDGSLAAHVTVPTGSHFHQNAKAAFTGLLARESIQQEEVRYVMATGYGRKLYREADEIISEITANCIGKW
jgi:activator of 2-hydroxyglutaryl-CoA dehydratase